MIPNICYFESGKEGRERLGGGVPIYWTNSLLVPIRHRELVLKKVKGKSFKEDLSRSCQLALLLAHLLVQKNARKFRFVIVKVHLGYQFGDMSTR